MTKLLISDITLMGAGFCVIGLEDQAESLRSIRPLPPGGNAWSRFPYRRGDVLDFDLSFIPIARPHLEDRRSSGSLRKAGQVSEADLVGYLRKAEMAEDLQGLFHCGVRENVRGSGIYVEPEEVSRSICGCPVQNIRFQLLPDAVRATLLLPSGETLRDLPVVDRDWNEFIRRVLQETVGANQLHRTNRLLNGQAAERVLNAGNRLARIGLTRLFNDKHWLMLDSLFPLPEPGWINQGS